VFWGKESIDRPIFSLFDIQAYRLLFLLLYRHAPELIPGFARSESGGMDRGRAAGTAR